MKALQYREIGAEPEVVEIETPEPAPWPASARRARACGAALAFYRLRFLEPASRKSVLSFSLAMVNRFQLPTWPKHIDAEADTEEKDEHVMDELDVPGNLFEQLAGEVAEKMHEHG